MDAKLSKKGLLYRCLEVNTREGEFAVEWNGRGLGHETVLVNRQVASQPASETWFIPRFKFKIGSADAVLTVRVWPWLAIRSLKLIVDGETVYHEGAAEEVATAEELDYLSTVRPEGIQVVKSEGESTIIRKWPRGGALGFAFFAVVLWGFSIVIVIASGWVGILFVNPLNYVGLWMAYRALTFVLNTTEITVNQQELAVQHGPLPYWGRRNKTFLVNNIAELECVGKERDVEAEEGGLSVGFSIPYYELHVVGTDGKRENILPDVRGDMDHVLFVKQEIEHFLAQRAAARRNDVT